MGNFFSMDGNIKQQFLPFVLNPSDLINKSSLKGGGNGSPQLFSFRNVSTSGSKARLGMMPRTFDEYIANDYANHVLYSRSGTSPTLNNSDITLTNFLENIPGIQIREYLPNTALDQIVNMIADLFKKNGAEKSGDTSANDESKKQEQQDGETKVMDFFTDKTASKFEEVIKKATLKGQGQFSNIGSPDYKHLVLSFAYNLYYRILSSTTTNIYVLPLLIPNRELYKSEGAGGWGAGTFGLANLIPGFGEITKKVPIVGDYVSSMLNSITIEYQKPWDPTGRQKSGNQTCEVKFNLFNDEVEKSVMNFIFVNTIVPDNRWMQYGIFTQGPCLYDVKFEGYSRWYMASGNMSVKEKGITRNPSSKFFDILDRHINSNCMGGNFSSALRSQHLVRLPDMYEISMTFGSILPDNFNNFLFNYTSNNDIDKEYSSKSQEESVISISDLIKKIKDAIG